MCPSNSGSLSALGLELRPGHFLGGGSVRGWRGGARGAVGTGRLTVLCPQASPPSGGSPVPVACATHGRTSLEFSAVPTTLTLEQTGLSKEGLDGFGFPAHGPFF